MIAARRQFLKTGLAGSLLLGCAGWLNAAGARPLSDAEREMLGALTNALLDGALPTDLAARRRLIAVTIDGIAVEIAGLSLASQKEIGELFGLLVSHPAGGSWPGSASLGARRQPATSSSFCKPGDRAV
jgi:hypothetical protein